MQELLYGAGMVCVYLVAAASAMLLARALIRIPDELFRKMLHFVLLGAYIPFVFAFDRWELSVALIAALAVLIYPILSLAERLPRFSVFVTERKSGEFKKSMLLALGMLAACITVCRGVCGDRYLVLACMYAWGVGDAFAALIGKRYGRHKIRWRYTDGKKSVEGSTAMFVSSVISVAAVLWLRGGLSAWAVVVIALAAAAATTVVEMVSRGGYDTITCPTAAMAVILPLTALFGGLA